MNLATLAERACLESGYNDAGDVSAAKQFARHWDEHIHNAALWKDALVTADIAVDPANDEDHADGVIFLPQVIDRVVGVRCPTNQIVVQSEERYYRLDWDAFEASGNPWEFVTLPPAWFKWRSPAVGSFLSAMGAAGDSATSIRLVWQDGSGKRTVTDTTVGGGVEIEPDDGVSVTMLAAYKAATASDVVIQNLAGITCENNFTSSATFATAVGSVAVASGQTGLCPSASTVTSITASCSDGDRTVNGITMPFGAATLSTIPMLDYSEAAYGALSLVTVATFAAAATRCTSAARIRLLPKPTEAFTLKVIGKAAYLPLDFDQQEPALRNLNNSLLAFVRGSLKRRGGEYAAAQLEFAEANALLRELQSIEALQAANNTRFTPEMGYGPEYGIGPAGGGGGWIR